MRYTVEHTSLVNNNYITLNIEDIVIGIDINAAPDAVVVFRVNKTGRHF